jgi:type I restriction enzyme S subunit
MPVGWVSVELSEIAETSSGGTPSRKDPKNYDGTIPWIKSGNLKDGHISQADEFISDLALKNSAAKLFPAGTLLIALYGATIGKLGILSITAATNQAVCGIFPSDHGSTPFLFSFLVFHRRKLIELGQGGAQPNISQQIVRSIEIPLPPINEQKRIVSKIEELFSELDAGEESLRRARRQLGVYRQSLLKQAFEGKLTEQWRIQNPHKLESPEQLLSRIQEQREARYEQQLKEWDKAGRLGRRPSAPSPISPLTEDEKVLGGHLPPGWKSVPAEAMGDVQLGRQRSPKNQSKDYPTKYIRAANITESGLALDDILEMEFSPQERRTFTLQAGDLVLSEASGSASQVGKPAMWRGEIPACCFQNTVIRHRLFDREQSVFYLWLYRFFYLHGIFSRTAGGVGINHLSAGKFSRLPVPLCSLPEQHEIVRRLDEQFTVIEQNEREIDAALKRSAGLRQSILKKAFTGQLVPQDPTDEPASALLERIRKVRNGEMEDPKKKSGRRA